MLYSTDSEAKSNQLNYNPISTLQLIMISKIWISITNEYININIWY